MRVFFFKRSERSCLCSVWICKLALTPSLRSIIVVYFSFYLCFLKSHFNFSCILATVWGEYCFPISFFFYFFLSAKTFPLFLNARPFRNLHVNLCDDGNHPFVKIPVIFFFSLYYWLYYYYYYYYYYNNWGGLFIVHWIISLF